jgi:hypothetical protein
MSTRMRISEVGPGIFTLIYVNSRGCVRITLPLSAVILMKVAMTGLSVIAFFLIGGFGIFYGLSSASAPGYAVLLSAAAWAALCVWIWIVTQQSEDR